MPNSERKRVILMCGTPGLDLNVCAKILSESANEHSHTCVREPICVEHYIPTAAADRLSRILPDSIADYSLADALGLPYDELVLSANEALNLAIAQTLQHLDGSTARWAIVTVHPVLFHQRTSEFITPYYGSGFVGLTQFHDIVRVVSVHDDVYDVYRRLMRRGRLFDPELTRIPTASAAGDEPMRRREPLQDLQEVRLLLDWRDRELAASSSLSVQLRTDHLLFHRKGRLAAIRQILFDDRRAVYFSHPISQPRSDLLRLRRPGKNETPDPSRGKALQLEIEKVANRLSHYVPLVEPTAIDEYRIDDTRWSELNEAVLSRCILPPLTDRWPSTRSDERLGGVPDRDEEDESGGLSRVAPSVFQTVACENASLVSLKAASDLLKTEILRQINVRDHVLAEQARIVVAFRPYALPDGFEPTGGVEKEIEAQERMADLNPALVGKIIIVHPASDERRRRRNQFAYLWKVGKGSWFEEADGDRANALGSQLAVLIEELPIECTPQQLKAALLPTVKRAVTDGLRMKQAADDSSMATGAIIRYENQPAMFLASVLRNSEIVESRLQVRAKRSPNLIEFHIADTVTVDLAKRIGELT
jgi:hypothetical protein